jgi:hypothetical protein
MFAAILYGTEHRFLLILESEVRISVIDQIVAPKSQFSIGITDASQDPRTIVFNQLIAADDINQLPKIPSGNCFY